jgi:hypothetical protein
LTFCAVGLPGSELLRYWKTNRISLLDKYLINSTHKYNVALKPCGSFASAANARLALHRFY